jgi:hypothetical protein
MIDRPRNPLHGDFWTRAALQAQWHEIVGLVARALSRFPPAQRAEWRLKAACSPCHCQNAEAESLSPVGPQRRLDKWDFVMPLDVALVWGPMATQRH